MSKELRKQGMKILLNDDTYEENMNDDHEVCSPKSFITFRGSVTKSPSSRWTSLPDSYFFSSDTGKEIILADQEAHEKERTLQIQNLDCTGCSSWTNENVNSQITSISAYLERQSEPLGELSAVIHSPSGISLKNENLDCAGCSSWTNENFNTPKTSICTHLGRRSDRLSELSTITSSPCEMSFKFSFRYDTPTSVTRNGFFFLDKDKTIEDPPGLLNIDYENESVYYKTSSLATPLLYSVTPKTEDNSFLGKFYTGSTNYRNIQRLTVLERKRGFDEITEMSFHSLEINQNSTPKSSSRREKSTLILPEMWTVEPQEVQLDSTKGSRVTLINNSDHILRFKSKCDGKILNVCPLSGNVPAKGNIGLRIVISLQMKLSNENTETDIKIIIGKTVKIIHVKVQKEKSKKFKERKYMLK